MSCRAMLMAGAVLALGSHAVLAADSRLQVVIGGEAYDGAPRFAVSFDGVALGEAEIAAAIDTVTEGRFAEAEERSAHVGLFEFTIPEAAFKPGGEVRIRLLNEAFGGEGSNRDRNLYLAAVAVNGRAVTLSGFATEGAGATGENAILDEFLLLADGNVEGVTRPPAAGWPLPGSTPQSAAAEPPAPAAVPAPVAAVTPPAPAPAATVSAEIAPAAAGEACMRDEIYNVVGFNESSNDLTPRLEQRLDQIIADIGPERCRVLVTGYSSRQGAHATNALFAIERAQNVLAYLRANGLQYQTASATGGGATDQFGSDSGANRRVVIRVSP